MAEAFFFFGWSIENNNIQYKKLYIFFRPNNLELNGGIKLIPKLQPGIIHLNPK